MLQNQTCETSLVWPLGKHRSPWAARKVGVSRGRYPRRKGKAPFFSPLVIFYRCDYISFSDLSTIRETRGLLETLVQEDLLDLVALDQRLVSDYQ